MDKDEAWLTLHLHFRNQIDELGFAKVAPNPDQFFVQELNPPRVYGGGDFRNKRLQKLMEEGDEKLFEVLIMWCHAQGWDRGSWMMAKSDYGLRIRD